MSRPRRRPALALLLALLLLLPVAVSTAAAQGQDAEFDRIAEETAALRGLPIETEIGEAFLTPAQLRDRLVRDLAEEYPADEVAADERALEAFGLIPAGTDLDALMLDLLGEQIAGFYDPETDEMYVISGDEELGAVEEFTYSHEVAHALQDQTFDLERVQAAFADGTNDDADLAVTALIEGDAVAASVEYLMANPFLAARLAATAVDGGEQIESAPPIIVQTLLSPYIAEQRFVTTLRQTGGWEAVNAAYADLPASMEQVLHPEKYLERDDPTPVPLPDLAPVLGAGWERMEENTFGELQTAIVLANQEPGQGLDSDLPDAAEAAAAGWDGDRYAVWTKGDEDVVVWASVWDGEAEAAEFAAAAETYGTTLTEDGQVLRVEQSSAEVRFVLAPSAALADAALVALAES